MYVRISFSRWFFTSVLNLSREPSTPGYIKVACDQPGSSSEDPPPAKYRKISLPLSDGGASNNSGARLAPTAGKCRCNGLA